MAKKKIYKHHQRDSFADAETDAQTRELVLGKTGKKAGVKLSDGTFIDLNPVLNAKTFGAKGDGVTNDTAAIAAAYAAAVAGGGELYIPPGTYLGNWQFTAEAAVRGAGIRRTVLKPWTSASPCVLLTSAGGDGNLGVSLSRLSIYCTKTGGVYDKVGRGLVTGTALGESAFSLGEVTNLDVRGFEYNIFILSAICGNFRQIWSSDGTYGLFLDSERNITTNSFETVRVSTCTYGMRLRAGAICSFRNCASESSTYHNLMIQTGVSSGIATKMLFDNCWFEDITGSSGTRSGIYFDMDPTISPTNDMAVVFNRCVISTPNGIMDVRADRAQNILFDHCGFSSTADKFTGAKFSYATGDNSVRIMLRNCGVTVTSAPSDTLYASFPALTRNSGGAFGYFYEFTQGNGKQYDNFRTISTTTDLTNQSAAYLAKILVDASGGTVLVNSFVGGTDGQMIRVLKSDPVNTVRIVNNASGTEKIFTRSGANLDLLGDESVLLTHMGGHWYEVGYDPAVLTKNLQINGRLTAVHSSGNLTPTMLAQGVPPRIALNNTSGGTNQKWWELSASSDQLAMRVRQDDGTESTQIFTARRPSGTTISAWQFYVPMEYSIGAALTAANDLALGADGNVFVVNGNTQINALSIHVNIRAPVIYLVFSGTPTVKHNGTASSGYKKILLAGSVDLVAAANTVLVLVYDGTQWQEVSRKVA